MACGIPSAETPVDAAARRFSPATDLISLHYDHAPDKDDGHSAAADRTLLQARFGADWLVRHVVAVSGTYGWLGFTFQDGSDAVMDAAWSDASGWVSAHADWDGAVERVATLWIETLTSGGDVWVKEGGPSDFTAAVLDELVARGHEEGLSARVHVIQHATGNQVIGLYGTLRRVQKSSDYRRIPGGNATLLRFGGDRAFVDAARAHAVMGPVWSTAFEYYDPDFAVDFSDTAATYHILDLGTPSLDDFRVRFLSEWRGANGPG